MEKRLYGTWISDKTTTLERWRWPKGITRAKKKRFSDLFGKLQIRFSKNYLYTDLEGFKQKQKYRVIASDEASVVLQRIDTPKSLKEIPVPLRELATKYTLRHIFFDGDRYWVPVGWNQEWFRRLPEAKKKQTKRDGP